MTTGTDVIRQAINVRNKKVNLAGFATEVGISPSQLSDFMAGRSVPSATILCAMAKWLWPNAEFDPERNLLVSGANRAPSQTMTSDYPPPVVPDPNWKKVEYTGGRLIAVFPALPEAEKKSRPGWAK